MPSWSTNWARTEHPGIYAAENAHRVRVRLLDPRSGRLREANRVFVGLTPAEAGERRSAVRDELAKRLVDPPRRTVEEFGRYWLAEKRPLIDPGTYDRYRSAVEQHAMAWLGRTDLQELRSMQVQEWINCELRRG
jgi:hypothetical protein